MIVMLVGVVVSIPALIAVRQFPRVLLITALTLQMMNLVAIRLLGDSGTLVILTQVIAVMSCIAMYFKHNTTRLIGKLAVCVVFLSIYGLVVGYAEVAPVLQILSVKTFVYPFIFFLLRSCPRAYLKPVLTAVCWLTCLNAVCAVIEKFVGVAALHALGLQYGSSVRTIDGELRSPGLLPTNFDLGLVCAVVFVLCFYSVYLSHDIVSRRLGVLTLTLSGIGLICSTTRSGIVIVLLAVLVLLADAKITTAQRTVIYLSLSSGLAYVLFSGSALGSNASFWQRQDVWKALINQFGNNLGLGFGAVGGMTYSTYNTGGIRIFVDNYFLSLYLQLGLLGGLVFLAILFALFRGAGRIGLALVVGLVGSFLLLETWEYSLAMSLLAIAVAANVDELDTQAERSLVGTDSQLQLPTYASRA